MKKMLKKCIKYALNKFGEINIGIFNKKKPSFYALKGKRLIEKNRIRAAIKTFKKGLYFYPNSLLIHREWTRYLMSINEWEKAIYHWEFVFKSKNKKLLNSNDFLNASDAYIHKNQYEKASRILEKGNKAFPFYKTEYDLNQINILLIQKKWKLALDFLIENQPPNTDLNLRYIYKKLNLYKHVKRVLRANTKYSLEYKEISEAYINLSIYRKNWNAAINRGKHLIKQHSNLSIEILMKLGMLHQIIGSHQEASGLFKRIEVMQDKNTQKHQKIILFDNGESRIEFYKKSHEVEKVIITFDSINMEWDKQPFGFSLLKKKNIDIIAVRKRKKQTYQQDLTQEDFYNTVYKLMYFYTDKIAYGFSLG